MKAGVIGAVAIGGATIAVLAWGHFRVDVMAPTSVAATAPATAPPAAASADASAASAAAPAPDPAAAPVAAPAGTAAGSPETTEAETDRLAAIEPAAAVPAVSAGAGPDDAEGGRQEAAPDHAPEVARTAMPVPSFDIVRVAPDGQTVIAGRSAPGRPVEVLLDGETVETARTDAAGRFVAVVAAGASRAARELRLRTTLPEAAPMPAAASPEGTEVPAGDAGSAAPGAIAAAGATALPTRAPGPAAPAPAASPTTAPTPGTTPGTASAAPAEPGPAGRPALSSDPTSVEPAQATAGAEGDQAPAVAAAAPPAERQILSVPVVILPPVEPGEAPALVRSDSQQLTLLQPAGPAPGRVVLDQLTRAPDGELLLRGRARPRHAVRVYGNGREIGTAAVADGGWSLAVPGARAEDIRLFRLDEIGRAGEVASRVEVPFAPSDAASQVLRDRRITVVRGDNLWRIAEQHYGEGLRYSLIFGANSDLIRDPDLIYPDQVFTVPELVETE